MFQKKIIKAIYVLTFICIIFFPFVFANRNTDQISKTENRYLNNPPTARIGTEEHKEQLENWLNDNLAFRSEFLNLRSWILYKGFKKN